jgi:hypothetical protein
VEICGGAGTDYRCVPEFYSTLTEFYASATQQRTLTVSVVHMAFLFRVTHLAGSPKRLARRFAPTEAQPCNWLFAALPTHGWFPIDLHLRSPLCATGCWMYRWPSNTLWCSRIVCQNQMRCWTKFRGTFYSGWPVNLGCHWRKEASADAIVNDRGFYSSGYLTCFILKMYLEHDFTYISLRKNLVNFWES